MTTQTQIAPVDLERIVELDFVRTTEATAFNAHRWYGRGDPQAAHAAAVDAMRGTMDSTSVSATVIFGDGLKPQTDSIEPGEKLGNWLEGSLNIKLATIPIDGIDLVARGLPGAISVLVAACDSENSSALFNPPCCYMEKIAYGRVVKEGPSKLHLDASVRDNLEIIALKLGKRLQDLKVVVLDRKRHEKLIHDIRKAGASVRLINDGEISACIAVSLPDPIFDVYMGIGGAAETVMAGAAINCLGGDMLARLAPSDEQEKQQIIDSLSEDALGKHYHAEDLARGDNIVFCATGISDSYFLRNIHISGSTATTYSVVMRSRYRTVRYIRATHDLSRKTIRLRSANAEAKL